MNRSEIRSFGEELRAFRERKRMSQLELAKALGVNRQTIVAWELGKNPPKDRTRVLELAPILGLNDRETNILLAAAFLDPLPPWHVPYHRNPLFTGREEFLQELHRVLIPGKTAAVSQSRAISGLGGIGKTQTALEYAYRYRNDYAAVIWLQADSRDIFFAACMQLAHDLGLPEREEADQVRVIAAVKRWFKNKTKWLLVLDNVEDFPLVEEFLPPGHHGCVLLTTRAHQVTEHIALVHELEVLPEEEGTLLLLRRAGRVAIDAPLSQADSRDLALAKELWELAEGLPLALDQMGAYVRATGRSLADYRALYVEQQRRLDLLKERGKIPPGHPESAATTFSIAFEKVQRLNTASAEILVVCAYLQTPIPEEILVKGGNQLGHELSSLAGDPLLFDQAIFVLQTYSLIRRNAQDSTLSLHRLVQVVMRDTIQPSDQEMWLERVIAAMDKVFPQVEDNTWDQCDRLLPQALACIDHTRSWKSANTKLASLLMKIADCQVFRNAQSEAKRLYQRALLIYEQAQGPDHPQVAYTLNQLAEVHRRMRWYSKAEPLYLQALRIYEQIGWRDHSDVAYPLNGLADLYSEQRKYAEAESLYQHALSIWEQSWGLDHPLVTRPLNGLADLYSEQGKYEQAEPLYQRALHIYEQTQSPDYLQTVYTPKGFDDFWEAVEQIEAEEEREIRQEE